MADVQTPTTGGFERQGVAVGRRGSADDVPSQQLNFLEPRLDATRPSSTTRSSSSSSNGSKVPQCPRSGSSSPTSSSTTWSPDNSPTGSHPRCSTPSPTPSSASGSPGSPSSMPGSPWSSPSYSPSASFHTYSASTSPAVASPLSYSQIPSPTLTGSDSDAVYGKRGNLRSSMSGSKSVRDRDRIQATNEPTRPRSRSVGEVVLRGIVGGVNFIATPPRSKGPLFSSGNPTRVNEWDSELTTTDELHNSGGSTGQSSRRAGSGPFGLKHQRRKSVSQRETYRSLKGSSQDCDYDEVSHTNAKAKRAITSRAVTHIYSDPSVADSGGKSTNAKSTRKRSHTIDSSCPSEKDMINVMSHMLKHSNSSDASIAAAAAAATTSSSLSPASSSSNIPNSVIGCSRSTSNIKLDRKCNNAKLKTRRGSFAEWRGSHYDAGSSSEESSSGKHRGQVKPGSFSACPSSSKSPVVSPRSSQQRAKKRGQAVSVSASSSSARNVASVISPRTEQELAQESDLSFLYETALSVQLQHQQQRILRSRSVRSNTICTGATQSLIKKKVDDPRTTMSPSVARPQMQREASMTSRELEAALADIDASAVNAEREPIGDASIDRRDWVARVYARNPHVEHLVQRIDPTERACKFGELYNIDVSVPRNHTPTWRASFSQPSSPQFHGSGAKAPAPGPSAAQHRAAVVKNAYGDRVNAGLVMNLIQQHLHHEGLNSSLNEFSAETGRVFVPHAYQDSKLVSLLRRAITNVEQVYDYIKDERGLFEYADLEAAGINMSARAQPYSVNLDEEEREAATKEVERLLRINQKLPPHLYDMGLLSESLPVDDVNSWDEPAEGNIYRVAGTGHIRCATLNQLVACLTSRTDFAFMKTFLMTYQSFTSPQILFLKLLQRYNVPVSTRKDKHRKQQKWITEVVHPVQVRVCNVLSQWILSSSLEFLEDKVLLHRLREFVEGTLQKDGHIRISRKVTDALIKKQSRTATNVFTASDPPAPKVTKHIFSQDLDLMEVDDEELARQITISVFQVFKMIEPQELLHQSWVKKQYRPQKATNVLRVINDFNLTSKWVAATVLAATKRRARARLMAKFIKVTEHLRNLNNFHSTMAVLAGLNGAALYRLKHTRAELDQRSLRSLESLRTEMSSASRYKTYNRAFKSSAMPCIPYLGVSLTDLTYINDGNPDFDVEHKHLVNFAKRRMSYEVISSVQQCQLQSYVLQEVAQIQLLLEARVEEDEEELYELSLKLESRSGASR